MIKNTKKIRPAVVKNGVTYIPVYSPEKTVLVAVDTQDAHLDFYAWILNTKGYPCTRERGKSKGRRRILMHRMIMNAPEGMVVDHINRNPLDNRRQNLRVCTQYDNVRNCKRHSSKYAYRGVRPNGRGWMAYLTYKGKQMYLGTHTTIELAALAYNQKAQELFSEFAVLNEVHING